MVLLPFDTVALTRPEARRTEEAIRRALARTQGVCLEPRKETVERLRAREGKQEACAEDTLPRLAGEGVRRGLARARAGAGAGR